MFKPKVLGRLAVIAFAVATPSLAAESFRPATEIRVLDNVFLVRDKPGTQLSFHMLVNAGCGDEAGNQCKGLAHYLEHIVLTGRNPEHKDAAVRLFGNGSANGWTNRSATAYVHSVPARPEGNLADLEQLFTFYAARLKDFAIDPAEADRERNVVLQEHDLRIGSSPATRFSRSLDARLIPNHVAGQWTIGTRETIQALTLDDARAFHKRWYVLNNVSFIIKGDLEPDALKALAERALAGLKPHSLPARNVARPIEFVPGREDVRESHPQVTRATVIFKKLISLPDTDTSQARAARVMVANFLGSQLPGSANHALTEVRVLAAGRPHVNLDRAAPGRVVLTVSAECAPDVQPDELLAAITSWVDGLSASTLTPETLTRLKLRFANGTAEADKQPAQVHSRLINWLASRNKYPELQGWRQQVADVPAGTVAAATAALAGPGRIVTGILEPTARTEASK